LDGEFQQSNAALAVALCKEYLAHALKQRTLPSSEREKVERDLAQLASGEGLPAPFKLGKTKSLTDTTQTLTFFILGLSQCKWPGRGQTIQLDSPEWKHVGIYIDGAHTEESVTACVHWFREVKERNGGINVLVFNCNKTKDAQKMLHVLVGSRIAFSHVIFTTFDTRNTMKVQKRDLSAEKKDNTATTKQTNPLAWQEANAKLWEDLRETETETGGSGAPLPKEKKAIVGSLPEVLDELKGISAENPDSRLNVLVTGSLYLVGGVLEVLIANGSLSEAVLDL